MRQGGEVFIPYNILGEPSGEAHDIFGLHVLLVKSDGPRITCLALTTMWSMDQSWTELVHMILGPPGRLSSDVRT
jgi:hypothetical protein